MKKINKTKYKKWLVRGLTIFLVLIIVVCLLFLLFYLFDKNYEQKFYPGIKINDVKLSGLTSDQANKIFNTKIEELNRDGQIFAYQNKNVTLYPVVISTSDPDLAKELIIFNTHQTLDAAFELGKGKNIEDKLWQKIKYIFSRKNFDLDIQINTQEIKKILTDNFGSLETPGNNPGLEFMGDNINITQENSGLTFDYDSVIEKLKNNLINFDFKPINLNLVLDEPDFKAEEAEFLIEPAQEILTLTPLKIQATTTDAYDREWTRDLLIYQNDLTDWLTLKWDQNRKQPRLAFEPIIIKKFLDRYAHQIETQVREAKFKLTNDKVTEFQPSQSGKQINLGATIKLFEQDIIENRNDSSRVLISIIEPEQATQNINDLGISKLIGVGKSSYAGSPPNRRHNIKVGAESLNGLLIKPGEEFSMNASLGDITAAKGYLPELVIKGNETIPEYGGGLCQIATTAFRLAINSGLEITNRKNHAYRVGYYEPAGTDATIYSPWPDLRFLNDTPNHILLQAKVIPEQSEVVFEFWGTHDGRQVATTSPEIYNITSPGPTKYVETTDLEPEQVKCLEIAHNGADAHFYRTISYPDQEPEEEIFESHYRPWQAVCLVGVDPAKLATTTEEIITE